MAMQVLERKQDEKFYISRRAVFFIRSIIKMIETIEPMFGSYANPIIALKVYRHACCVST